MSTSSRKSQKSATFKIRQRRVFSDDFKREKVEQITSGQYTIAAFCKLWELNPVTVYDWIYKFSPHHKRGTTMVIQKDSETVKTQQLQQRVAELERCLGQKQMALDYLEKLIELASAEMNIDIKKNYRPLP